MIQRLSKDEIAALIAPPPIIDKPGKKNLTENQEFALMQWARWGSDSYPIRKGAKPGNWFVDGIRGQGHFPNAFKTKKAAIAAYEGFIDMLRDYDAGRIPNPAMRGQK